MEFPAVVQGGISRNVAELKSTGPTETKQISIFAVFSSGFRRLRKIWKSDC